ncbi:MAG: hypothetical protein ACR2G2_18645 [Pseudonocardia sp.]
MRQRAALLRTVVQDRPVLLLNEPFGALDSLTRSDMQSWLEGVRARFDWTMLLITHDVREAVSSPTAPAGRRTGLCRVV